MVLPIFQLLFLFSFLFLVSAPQIRRITKDKDFFIYSMGANLVPVEAASIATDNLSNVLQRQGFGIHSKVLIQFGVHLVLCQPKG